MTMAPLATELPFVLRPENVARYENGEVVIADRRRFPFERVFVRCRDIAGVGLAIKTMVTQGAGPWVAAAYALVMVARQARDLPADEMMERLNFARSQLIATRPTNTTMNRVLASEIEIAERALEAGEEVEESLLAWVQDARERYYERSARIATVAAELVGAGEGVLTMCFAELPFILAMSQAQRSGKNITVYVPETRPYLQGAHLTAPCLQEMGVPVVVVTDAMPAYLMSQGKVQKYFTAADLVTMDGHVVNKVGTLENAIVARYHSVPYFALTAGPDPSREGKDSIVIEERDPAELRSCAGQPTTLENIGTYYPAFDITPPELVSGLVTEHGLLSPFGLKQHFPVKK